SLGKLAFGSPGDAGFGPVLTFIVGIGDLGEVRIPSAGSAPVANLHIVNIMPVAYTDAGGRNSGEIPVAGSVVLRVNNFLGVIGPTWVGDHCGESDAVRNVRILRQRQQIASPARAAAAKAAPAVIVGITESDHHLRSI